MATGKVLPRGVSRHSGECAEVPAARKRSAEAATTDVSSLSQLFFKQPRLASAAGVGAGAVDAAMPAVVPTPAPPVPPTCQAEGAHEASAGTLTRIAPSSPDRTATRPNADHASPSSQASDQERAGKHYADALVDSAAGRQAASCAQPAAVRAAPVATSVPPPVFVATGALCAGQTAIGVPANIPMALGLPPDANSMCIHPAMLGWMGAPALMRPGMMPVVLPAAAASTSFAPPLWGANLAPSIAAAANPTTQQRGVNKKAQAAAATSGSNPAAAWMGAMMEQLSRQQFAAPAAMVAPFGGLKPLGAPAASGGGAAGTQQAQQGMAAAQAQAQLMMMSAMMMQSMVMASCMAPMQQQQMKQMQQQLQWPGMAPPFAAVAAARGGGAVAAAAVAAAPPGSGMVPTSATNGAWSKPASSNASLSTLVSQGSFVPTNSGTPKGAQRAAATAAASAAAAAAAMPAATASTAAWPPIAAKPSPAPIVEPSSQLGLAGTPLAAAAAARAAFGDSPHVAGIYGLATPFCCEPLAAGGGAATSADDAGIGGAHGGSSLSGDDGDDDRHHLAFPAFDDDAELVSVEDYMISSPLLVRD